MIDHRPVDWHSSVVSRVQLPRMGFVAFVAAIERIHANHFLVLRDGFEAFTLKTRHLLTGAQGILAARA